ncbi:MAG: Abi-alpha family protein [Candidatus Sulfotelmatobacter sp.]
MVNTGEIDPTELAGELVEKTLDSEPVRNLLGPLTKNLGLLLGQVSDVARFYTEQNLSSIFTKWAVQRKGEPLGSRGFKRVLPLLRDAAMQSDDELQERWASLLENVANDTKDVLPSFGQTLSQITSAEARYLDRIWESVTAPKPYNSGKRQGRDELSYFSLLDIYSPKLRAPSPAEMCVFRDRMSPEQLAAFEEMTSFELMLHDIERLSLLEKVVKYVSGNVRRYEIDGEDVSIPSERSGIMTSYALTQYGVNFILAVRPNRPSGN